MKKSGLKIAKVTELVQALKSNVDGIIASTIYDERTHEWMLNRWRTEVIETDRFRKLPARGQDAVRYYFYGKTDMLGRYLVVFAYRRRQDGKLYRTSKSWIENDWPLWDQISIEQGSFNPERDCTESGDYWPSGNPFFVKKYEAVQGVTL